MPHATFPLAGSVKIRYHPMQGSQRIEDRADPNIGILAQDEPAGRPGDQRDEQEVDERGERRRLTLAALPTSRSSMGNITARMTRKTPI